VIATKKLKGQAKGMVVTRNIESAIHYFHAIRDALKSRGANFKAVIAFSGSKTVDGIEYTEDVINGFPGKDIEAEFNGEEYRLLVVANKYLTGFDQPKLSTMYVDKKLQGVLAVQALSRLNRCNHGLGKRTEDMFVLDFFNTTDEIKNAFDPFYTSTTLSGATDVNVLHELKDQLDDVGVYDWHEVEQFNELFFSGVPGDQLSPIIETCVERFDNELDLEESEKVTFKVRAKQFVKIYAQMACIMPFENVAWEKLHWFLKFLIPKLKIQDPDQDTMDKLLESVDLSTYSLARTRLKDAIELDDDESEVDPQNPNPRNPGGQEAERDPLDEIIRVFNERWFQGWEATPEEQKIKLINVAQHVLNDSSYQSQVVDNPDEQNSRLAMGRIIQGAVNKERRKDLDLYKKFAQDEDFRRDFETMIINMLSQNQDAVKRMMEERV
jgi:type I restriction enzyme, R subunit